VSIGSSSIQSSFEPISDAASAFGGHLAQAVAVIITVVSFLLPWGVLALLVTWIWRTLRKRREARRRGLDR